MSEAEIPEASTPFERKVAITIALIAVVMSFVEMKGDGAKTETILKTNEMASQWSYYQSKSIKQSLCSHQDEMLPFLAANAGTKAEDLAKLQSRLTEEIGRYETEKRDIKTKAESLAAQVSFQSSVEERCGLSALFLQLAVVIASVAILAHSKPAWIGSILVGGAGAIIGLSSFFM